MKKTILVSFTMMALSMISSQAWAVRFSTYIEGTIVQKTNHQMILSSEKGTYWIDIEKRPVSFTRRTGPDRVGFWVGMDQIKRFRPVSEQTVKHMPTVGPIMIGKTVKAKAKTVTAAKTMKARSNRVAAIASKNDDPS